jgi:hypothetical protein
MSYAPIYSKINDLESRLTIVETHSKQMVINPSVVPMNSNDLFNVVSGLATKTDLPDLSGFATKAELPDVSGFATKAELPDVSGFATKAELPDVSGFATKAELPDLSGYATKADIPDVSDLYAKFEYMLNVISQLNIKLTEANEKIFALETSRI